MKKIFALALVAVCATGLFATAEEKKLPTIVEAAVGNKDFSTLVAAVKAAELVDTLSGDGPFTVFAPTNAAFEKLGKETIDAVLKDKKKLTAILTAHVVKGSVMAADVVKADGKKVETLQGTSFAVKVDGETVTLGGVKVIKTDIKCKNGVIHVIDAVLMPKE
ncbi:MAG: fasciclin domain-containing protein [Gemmataceae bacterium]|nr:fasciclin domain-containing protein [Planctomycetia bacterium]MBX3401072.1 fasciclin domain-containing protein [Gemmataceae bacterium]